ncbi:KH domain containing protein expressed [Citrus sinensis]|uniref:KH domain containing protein expressed n=1 Tax=Citrus sinensis TaxID=2711 RepID=A0ACB8K3N6_CITSI|nr:KH domain containing protein expressed [Citrus sinensis]
MDASKRNFFKKRPNNQFKRKGVVGIKKGNWSNSSREQSFGNSQPADTVYRILCPSRKIGGVIGKAGNIVKSLREETQAKITVADTIPGSEERVIIIYSSPTKIAKTQNKDDDSAAETKKESMEPHCAAQDALLKVHDRIIEEDLFGGMASDDDNENSTITARLLVPNNMVGCLLGKRGDVIQRLRSETGANIRVLPADRLPPCAMNTDEMVQEHQGLLSPATKFILSRSQERGMNFPLKARWKLVDIVFTNAWFRYIVIEKGRFDYPSMAMTFRVQISGKPNVAKRALYEVSTLLHQNPRKDKPPSSFPQAYGGQNFHSPPAPMADMHPLGNSSWPARNSSLHGMPSTPWMGGYGDQPSRMGSGSINSCPPGQMGEVSAEFSMKILCSAGKIGGVIGKGGFNVKQLQQETGASIHVEDAPTDSDERVIRASAFEGLWNPRSQTIDAILQLQNKTSEFSEKGTITTRLLVPSSKVGCILGQGGHVINEMRRRTQADIRVYSKDDKPKCASEDEELVQISGNFGVAKDALTEIASRLRARTLRDANVGAEPAPVGPVQLVGVAGGLPSRGPLPSGPVGAGISGGYEPFRGGYDYEPQSYPPPPSAMGYPNMNSAFEARIPNKAVGSVMGTGGSNIPNVGEVAGARVKLQDPHPGSSECIVDIRGSSEHLISAHGTYQSFMTSGQSMKVQPSSYQNINPQQSSCQTMSSHQSSYQNMNTQQSPYHRVNAQQSPYQNINPQQSSYPMHTHQGAGTNPHITPTQSSYYSSSAQQGTYPY